MAPRGGLLVGMHRDTREGKATGFEFMRIAQQDGRWVLSAQPGGGAVTAFAAVATSICARLCAISFATPITYSPLIHAVRNMTASIQYCGLRMDCARV